MPVTHQAYPLGTYFNKTVFPTDTPACVPIRFALPLNTAENNDTVIQGQGFHPQPIGCCHILIKYFVSGQKATGVFYFILCA